MFHNDINYYPNYSTRRLYFGEVETPNRFFQLLTGQKLSVAYIIAWQLKSVNKKKILTGWYSERVARGSIASVLSPLRWACNTFIHQIILIPGLAQKTRPKKPGS